MAAPPQNEEAVVAYHERTKHHPGRYAASLGYLDWATQPNPFRRYAGAPLVSLSLPPPGNLLPYARLFEPASATPLSLESVSQFFRYALSLTAWKRAGDSSWALRANPSSGNLHPTEGYAVLPALAGVGERPGVYHYAAAEHGLERRSALELATWEGWGLPEGGFLVGLTSIHWREAWKYGERAFRYCQHDVGHALGALRFSAAALGWHLKLVGQGESLSPLLGLRADGSSAEREVPELLALVSRGAPAWTELDALARRLAAPVARVQWLGAPNVLSAEHAVEWPVIDAVSAATNGAPAAVLEDFADFPDADALFGAQPRSGAATAERVILGRRSAVRMDGTTTLPAAAFFQMLGRLMPTRGERAMPWDALAWRPRLHLGLFVHRVTGLTPGLYALVRDPRQLEPLRAAMHRTFRWQRPEGCPAGLPLYLLEPGDVQSAAAGVSCEQDIAGDGVFSLGMIAEHLESLATFGAPFYRNLFWEAGLIGQVLYLEAEAAGLRATGIGCYFDDPVHALFGLESAAWQSLYHFTVGGPVEDKRLLTLPAYDGR